MAADAVGQQQAVIAPALERNEEGEVDNYVGAKTWYKATIHMAAWSKVWINTQDEHGDFKTVKIDVEDNWLEVGEDWNPIE